MIGFVTRTPGWTPGTLMLAGAKELEIFVFTTVLTALLLITWTLPSVDESSKAWRIIGDPELTVSNFFAGVIGGSLATLFRPGGRLTTIRLWGVGWLAAGCGFGAMGMETTIWGGAWAPAGSATFEPVIQISVPVLYTN